MLRTVAHKFLHCAHDIFQESLAVKQSAKSWDSTNQRGLASIMLEIYVPGI